MDVGGESPCQILGGDFLTFQIGVFCTMGLIDETILVVYVFSYQILISATCLSSASHASSSAEAKLQCGFECLHEILRVRRSGAVVS